jgi:hypothetical protein
MRRTIALAVFLLGVALPAPAFGLRYASPTGVPADDCQTVATACDLRTAIVGDGMANLPVNGEEVVVQPGAYTNTANLDTSATAFGLNIHGAVGQPAPVINTSGLGRILVSGGVISHLRIESTGLASETVNFQGGTGDRLFIRGTSTGSTPVCQCYGGLLRNSVLISTGPVQPALGVTANGTTSTVTYRNVTAYATSATAPAFRVLQLGAAGTLTFNVFNAIALNAAGGTDVAADGPNSTITLSHSNYRTISQTDGGVVEDAPAGLHQTPVPLFANPAGGDLTQTAGSPTIDRGIADPLNGALDLGGEARTVGSSTDIGADEFTPPASQPPSTQPKKCRKKKGKKKKKKTGATAAKKKKKKGCKKKKRKKK